MRRFIPKGWKIFVVIALVGFSSTLADVHLDEHSEKSSPKTDTCCVACCPAHNLGPMIRLESTQPPSRMEWPIFTEVSIYFEKVSSSVFHPPRLSA